MNRNVEIELSVALYHLRSPCSVVSPLEVKEAERASVVLPINHIIGGEESPVVHPKEVSVLLIVTCEDVKTVSVHYWCGVGGEASLRYRVLRLSRRGCEE